MAHGDPLCWHSHPPPVGTRPRVGTLTGQQVGRRLPPGAIIPEPGARSFRIAGRHRPESAVDDVKNENVLIGGCVAYLELMERPTPEITAFRAFWAAKNDPD